MRGLATVLVDQSDFGAGTSSRSSRLVHGGLRYLEQGDYRLVFEALRERLGRTISTLVPDANARQGVLPTGTVEVSPAVRPYLDAFPLPNGPGRGSGLASYLFGFNQQMAHGTSLAMILSPSALPAILKYHS